MLEAVTCPQFPHGSYYDIRVADGIAGGESTVAAVAVGKWESRAFCGISKRSGDLPPNSAQSIIRRSLIRAAGLAA